MSRVLIIGATGLLGGATYHEIAARGHEVHGAARRVGRESRLHEVDLRDIAQIEVLLESLAPDVVVKMTGGGASDLVGLAETHLVSTANLITAVSRTDHQPSLVVTGSAAEYGETEPGVRVDETSSLNPVSEYGWIKSAETAMATSLARSQGLRLTLVRPFNVVSAKLPESTALGNFRRQIIEGSGLTREVRCGRVDIVRDYVTPSFVGRAVAELIEGPYEGAVNICSGHGIKLEDLLHAAAAVVGADVRFTVDPALAEIPAPDYVVGDPTLLYSLIEARATTDSHELAGQLMGSSS